MSQVKPKVLLVDDEERILRTLGMLLKMQYRILTAGGGAQGLELLASEPVDVIISDQRMPQMTGVEFLRQVKARYPDTVRMVLSGYTELQSITDAINEGAIYRFLTKPWDDDQLRGHIADAFRSKEMADENKRLSQELAAANEQLRELLKLREGQLQRDDDPHQEADGPPEGGGNRAVADDAVEIFVPQVRPWISGRAQHPQKGDARGKHHGNRVDLIGQVMGVVGRNRGQNRDQAKHDQLNIIPHFASLRLGPVRRAGECESSVPFLTLPLSQKAAQAALIHVNLKEGQS